jgi:hypothetical protein
MNSSSNGSSTAAKQRSRGVDPDYEFPTGLCPCCSPCWGWRLRLLLPPWQQNKLKPPCDTLLLLLLPPLRNSACMSHCCFSAG